MKASDLKKDEYAEFYAKYIKQVGESNFLDSLKQSAQALNDLFVTISDDKMNHKYADGKWTIKEVLLHIIDAERVFAYRALRFARADKTNLPGFEENEYTLVSNANNRSKSSLLSEYNAQRASTIQLFSNFTNEMLLNIGIASGNPMSVRALGFVIAGHETHHCNVIKERYL
ncbi:MAG: DinB family protein [Flavobacteriaceae bacterium]